MSPRVTRRRRTTSGADQHREWLQLVETDGPFLALPVLKRVWPNGIDRIGTDDDRHLLFLDEVAAWEREQAGHHESWVRTVLRDLAEWGDGLLAGTELPPRLTVEVPERGITLRPWGALFPAGADRERDAPTALVLTTPPGVLPHEPGSDGWSATPVDRLTFLLRRHGVRVGVVTDGRWWTVVWAKPGVTTGSGTVDALTWREEPLVRDAFLALIGVRRLLGVRDEDRLPALFDESVLKGEEITEALGTQVRRAVELLVQAFSEARLDARRSGRPDPLPTSGRAVYEAAVTVMMRLVFLLFAEERGLLPIDRDLYRSAYSISTYLDLLEERAREGEELLDTTTRGWHRLLAVSRAVHGGASFEDVRMPAYGGSLFDGSRFPWLEATDDKGSLLLRVSDRVLLHVLRAIQVVNTDGQARRVSFREVDVEQIGYIYEGLLGYTCRDTGKDVILGLQGKEGEEPEIDLGSVPAISEGASSPKAFADALLKHLADTQPGARPPSVARLTKLYAAPVDEVEAKRLLRPVCAHDAALVAAVLPFFNLLRRDLRGLPHVVPAGGLVVVESASRRNAGAHYTPRSLAEEVVEHALEPLVYEPGPLQTADRSQWRLKNSAQILDLKVADIAVGSGAFLVAAARYLAARLVDAWGEEASRAGQKTPVTEESHDRLGLRARREVIAHCLYGADINEMAVEMCKLSLWLVSLDPAKPFSFVDDKVLLGNSLLGLTRKEQLRGLHIDPTPERLRNPGFTIDVERPLAEAARLRRDIASSPVDDADPQRSATHKTAMLGRAREVTDLLREVGDGVIAAGLVLGGKPGKKLETAYEDLALALLPAHRNDPKHDHLSVILATGLTPTVKTDYERWRPLHWILEVPDVMVRGGFDAVIGNPPFLGGQKLTGALGTNMRDWFVHQTAEGSKGSADLVAYFFLRAMTLLKPDVGQTGLIATNTVAQGDTRQVGLQRMVDQGFTIRQCVQSASWPSESANLEYAAVWGSLAPVAEEADRRADGVAAPRISSLLEPEGRVSGEPVRLKENRGIAFIGSYVLGKGFVLEPDEAQRLLDADPRNADVLFPYLNGEDLNSRPDSSPSRWVINFHDWSEERAREYREPYALVGRLVKPERAKNNRKVYRERWWQYAERRPAMVQAINGLEHLLAIAQTSRTLLPVRIANDRVCAHPLVVFAAEDYGLLVQLSSSVHVLWVQRNGVMMRTDARYTPSDVFDTFSRTATTSYLRDLGRRLDVERREIMLRRQLGLTALYNLINDPKVEDDGDVDHMRDLHVTIDEAVVAAYGWDDIVLDHGFHTYRQARRFTVSPKARVELLDRLLEENHRRAALEREQVGSQKKKTKTRRSAASQDEALY